MADHPAEAPDALAGSPGGGGAGEARAAVRVMSGREWKPGDVAVTAKGAIALCHNGGMMIDQGGAPWSDDRFPENLRPLVVIDPEDDAQIEALLRAWYMVSDADDVSMRSGRMQAALRSLITPPRPPEPTGLGAVVEDEDGATYIRRATDWTDVPWVRADKPGFYGWAEITAVTVLSEGVQ